MVERVSRVFLGHHARFDISRQQTLIQIASPPRNVMTEAQLVRSGLAAANWERQMWSKLGYIQGHAVWNMVSHQVDDHHRAPPNKQARVKQESKEVLAAFEADDQVHFGGRLAPEAKEGAKHMQELFDGLRHTKEPETLAKVYAAICTDDHATHQLMRDESARTAKVLKRRKARAEKVSTRKKAKLA
jgi:hypothetical protein